MKMIGVDVGPVRLPNGNPTPTKIGQLRDALVELLVEREETRCIFAVAPIDRRLDEVFELCKFMAILAAHCAVALVPAPHQMRSRRPAE